MLKDWIDYWIIRRSKKFDRYYYLSLYPDVLKEGIDPIRHYIAHGAIEGRNPSPEFNTLEYLRLNPDLDPRKINPFVHYIKRGAESASILQDALYLRQSEKDNREFINGNRVTFRDILIRLLLTDHKLTFPYNEDEIMAIGSMESNRVSLSKKYATFKQETLVSIIMPTFNRGQVIMDSINSVLKQTYTNWELLIIDDASVDDTAEIISEINDERVRYFRNPENLGAAGARNVGLENTRGGYVCYLDSDNQLHPDFLLIMVNEIKARPQFDVLYCAQRLNRINNGKREEEGVTFSVFHRPTLENYNFIDLGVIIHRAAAVEKIRFDPALRVLIDWDFILQLTRREQAYGVMCILSDYFINKAANQITANVRNEDSLKLIDQKHFCNQQNAIDLASSEVDTSRLYSPEAQIHLSAIKPVSIVIPSFECLDYLQLCVKSIEKFTQDIDYELIIVDNGSSPEVVGYLRSIALKDRIKVIFNQTNEGFTRAINQGIEAASPGNDILLLNNDTVVTRGWVEALQEVISLYPDAGLAVPSQVLLPGESTISIHRPRCVETREIDVNISLHHWNVVDPMFDSENGFMELSFTPFFCVYIPLTTLELTSSLDDQFGAHYYSDRFYCNFLREHFGKKIIYTPKSKVYHFVQQATKMLTDSDRLHLSQMMDREWIRPQRN